MTELVPAYSQKLQQLIEEANAALKQYSKWKGEAKSKILGAYKQAISDGYTPPAAKTLLESKLAYSERYIRECLPSDAKNENMVRLKKPANSGTVPQNSQENKDEVVNITTKHTIIENPYEESQDKLNDLIKETQEQRLKPISVESATERAKRLMQETGYDIDEDKEDIQIKLNDLQVQLDQTITKLSDSERNWIKKEKELTDKIAELEQLHKSNPNFKPASELVKPTSTNPDDDTSPVLRSVYKKTIGELNTRILELKDKLNEVQKYDEVIEIKNQKIALVIEATNLKSVTVDEAKSRRLN